jgi:hypothetical protein
MKLHKQIMLLSALALASAMPVLAQVEKVAIRTTGISCGSCAAVSEINLRRLVTGVDKVSISMAKEAIMVSYKPGAPFHPRDIREVLKPLAVGVLQFQITARGRIQEQGAKRFFVAGKDKFVLVADANALKIPPGIPVLIEGIVNDRPDPMELKIMTFKPLTQ